MCIVIPHSIQCLVLIRKLLHLFFHVRFEYFKRLPIFDSTLLLVHQAYAISHSQHLRSTRILPSGELCSSSFFIARFSVRVEGAVAQD